VSKERAARRAAREADKAAAAAERARLAARSARRNWLPLHIAAVAAWLRRRRPVGPLAARRRRSLGLIVFGFFIVQALTWAATADWSQRVAVLVASLFAVPVVAVFVL
jgi:hypothetical protein